MDEIVNNLSSPAWWIGVVFVGIFISLLAAYLKPFVDGTLAKLSTHWKKRIEKHETKRKEKIKLLQDNSEQRIAAHFQEMRFRIRATQYLIFSVMVLFFSFTAFDVTEGPSFFRIAVNVFFFIIMLAGMLEHYQAMKLKSIIIDSLPKDVNQF